MPSKLTLQKRLAAKILKVGESKIWIDPARLKDAQAAITSIDIKNLIKKGTIKKLPGKVRKPKPRGKKRRNVHGSRKGGKYARLPRKRKWMSTVRPLRAMLKELRAAGEVDNQTYKKLYMLVKGGQFRSRSHLQIYLEQRGLLKKGSDLK